MAPISVRSDRGSCDNSEKSGELEGPERHYLRGILCYECPRSHFRKICQEKLVRTLDTKASPIQFRTVTKSCQDVSETGNLIRPVSFAVPQLSLFLILGLWLTWDTGHCPAGQVLPSPGILRRNLPRKAPLRGRTTSGCAGPVGRPLT